MGLVVQPEMKAGDVVFFTENATHGTLAMDRRSRPAIRPLQVHRKSRLQGRGPLFHASRTSRRLGQRAHPGTTSRSLRSRHPHRRQAAPLSRLERGKNLDLRRTHRLGRPWRHGQEDVTRIAGKYGSRTVPTTYGQNAKRLEYHEVLEPFSFPSYSGLCQS